MFLSFPHDKALNRSSPDIIILQRKYTYDIEVMQMTSQALVHWSLSHFGRKEEVLVNIYLIIIISALIILLQPFVAFRFNYQNFITIISY